LCCLNIIFTSYNIFIFHKILHIFFISNRDQNSKDPYNLHQIHTPTKISLQKIVSNPRFIYKDPRYLNQDPWNFKRSIQYAPDRTTGYHLQKSCLYTLPPIGLRVDSHKVWGCFCKRRKCKSPTTPNGPHMGRVPYGLAFLLFAEGVSICVDLLTDTRQSQNMLFMSMCMCDQI
jgi:hypothetical protein